MTLSHFGVYRFNFHRGVLPDGGSECRLNVYKGAAAVKLATVTARLASGKTISLNRRCGDMIPTFDFDLTDADDLDNWSRQRIGSRP